MPGNTGNCISYLVDNESHIHVYVNLSLILDPGVTTYIHMLWILDNMPFEIANRYKSQHLIVQPADLRLDPPESYLFIHDGFLISYGVLYTLCYFFYMTRTYKDRTCAGGIVYLYARP